MKTLACIDDDEVVLQQYSLVFGELGYKVLLGQNGFDLGCFVSDGTIDAVILDLAMPGLDGISSIRRYAATKPSILKKIVVVSGALTESLSQEITKLGIPTIAKPCDFNNLVKEVELIANPTMSIPV
jgi:two-component system chemotaxis response regulator CheY